MSVTLSKDYLKEQMVSKEQSAHHSPDAVQSAVFLAFGTKMSECFALFLWCWFRKMRGCVSYPGIPGQLAKMLNIVPLFKKFMKDCIKVDEGGLGYYKGLWYEASEQAMDLTLKYYDQFIEGKTSLVPYYNEYFKSKKFEAYLKKEIKYHIFGLLKVLHVIRKRGTQNQKIILCQTPLNQFVVKQLQENYQVQFDIQWVRQGFNFLLPLFYFTWLLGTFFKRGFSLKVEKESYKLAQEAAAGMHETVIRDDILVDGQLFKKTDMLFLEVDAHDPRRLMMVQKVREAGYKVVSLPKLKIPFNKSLFHILYFYFWVPLRNFFSLAFHQQGWLAGYVLGFHKKALPYELLMNHYSIKCFSSIVNYDDIVATIIFNAYGTKSIIYQWTDLMVYKCLNHAFIAHNYYFTWSDGALHMGPRYYYVDHQVNIGCVYKQAYRDCLSKSADIKAQLSDIKPGQKIITFFDNSFDNYLIVEDFFLEFLELVLKCCRKFPESNVLIKPKNIPGYADIVTEKNRGRFLQLWRSLQECSNFHVLDFVRFDVVRTIVISDVVVTMGITSPSTVALLCGKDALYFDTTGNNFNIFEKQYKNKITFENQELLLNQIQNLLNEKVRCQDLISRQDIEKFDAFPQDSTAINCLRKHVYQLCEGKSI